MRHHARAASAPLLAMCAFVVLAATQSANAVHPVVRSDDGIFPIEIQLVDPKTNKPIARPVGVVAGLETSMVVATETGQIYMADVRDGTGTLLNAGGDNQHFAGLCIDSRPPGTLYATGRETGKLYAFNRRGELIVEYQITKPAWSDEPGPSSFLAGCIQTRFQLLITDAHNPWTFYLKLADEGEMRGRPPFPTNTKYQSYKVDYGGEWDMTQGPSLKAYGIEWTNLFNESVFVLNSQSGELFRTNADEKLVDGTMEKVKINGAMTTFPGGLSIKFDSVNERVMYIPMPHLNGIAVIEFSHTNDLVATFIRILKNALLKGPIGIGEFGNHLYPISGNFHSSGDTVYSLVKLPRHFQILDSPDDEFTTSYEDVEPDTSVYVQPEKVTSVVQEAPPAVGFTAPKPLSNPQYSPSLSTPPTPSPSPSVGAPVPEVAASATPQPTVEEETPSSAPSSGTVSTFSSAASTPTGMADEGGQGGSCFPADATVTLRDGRVVRMDEVRIGDEVLVERGAGANGGTQRFSAVFVFSHSDPTALAPFVRIRADGGAALDLTEGHYLYVNGKLAAAASVRPGDEVTLGDGRAARVRRVSREVRRGLYNPQTLDGTLVVNGIRVSAYTTAVAPRAACAMLAPLRGLFAWPGGHGVLRRVSEALARGAPRALGPAVASAA